MENVKWKKGKAGIESAMLTVDQIFEKADIQNSRKFLQLLKDSDIERKKNSPSIVQFAECLYP